MIHRYMPLVLVLIVAGGPLAMQARGERFIDPAVSTVLSSVAAVASGAGAAWAHNALQTERALAKPNMNRLERLKLLRIAAAVLAAASTGVAVHEGLSWRTRARLAGLLANNVPLLADQAETARWYGLSVPKREVNAPSQTSFSPDIPSTPKEALKKLRSLGNGLRGLDAHKELALVRSLEDAADAEHKRLQGELVGGATDDIVRYKEEAERFSKQRAELAKEIEAGRAALVKAEEAEVAAYKKKGEARQRYEAAKEKGDSAVAEVQAAEDDVSTFDAQHDAAMAAAKSARAALNSILEKNQSFKRKEKVAGANARRLESLPGRRADLEKRIAMLNTKREELGKRRSIIEKGYATEPRVKQKKDALIRYCKDYLAMCNASGNSMTDEEAGVLLQVRLTLTQLRESGELRFDDAEVVKRAIVDADCTILKNRVVNGEPHSSFMMRHFGPGAPIYDDIINEKDSHRAALWIAYWKKMGKAVSGAAQMSQLANGEVDEKQATIDALMETYRKFPTTENKQGIDAFVAENPEYNEQVVLLLYRENGNVVVRLQSYLGEMTALIRATLPPEAAHIAITAVPPAHIQNLLNGLLDDRKDTLRECIGRCLGDMAQIIAANGGKEGSSGVGFEAIAHDSSYDMLVAFGSEWLQNALSARLGTQPDLSYYRAQNRGTVKAGLEIIKAYIPQAILTVEQRTAIDRLWNKVKDA